MAQNYENLDSWKKSIEFASYIYRITKKFPKEEFYGLTNQIRRAVISVSSNIAEGAGRGSSKDFLRFVHMALGSLNEVESQLYIAKELEYLDNDVFIQAKKQVEQLGRLLGGFKSYLGKK